MALAALRSPTFFSNLCYHFEQRLAGRQLFFADFHFSFLQDLSKDWCQCFAYHEVSALASWPPLFVVGLPRQPAEVLRPGGCLQPGMKPRVLSPYIRDPKPESSCISPTYTCQKEMLNKIIKEQHPKMEATAPWLFGGLPTIKGPPFRVVSVMYWSLYLQDDCLVR